MIFRYTINGDNMEIPIGVSNRHVHLSKEHLQILFGEDYQLEVLKQLKQATDFASTAKVTLSTLKNNIENVRVIGPLRKATQVEISKTDAYFLGLNPPIRDSGDLKGSAPITIVGPRGSIQLAEGCIIASRHLHIPASLRTELGLDQVSEVSVQLGEEKSGILEHVHLKSNEDYTLELHIDTDDANAHFVTSKDVAHLVNPKKE